MRHFFRRFLPQSQAILIQSKLNRNLNPNMLLHAVPEKRKLDSSPLHAVLVSSFTWAHEEPYGQHQRFGSTTWRSSVARGAKSLFRGCRLELGSSLLDLDLKA
jgi:hypothetical protein